MSHDWAEEIAKQLLNRDLMRKGTCLVLGSANTGKTALVAAIANGGCFTTDQISAHTKTNMEVIKKFLPIDFIIEQQGDFFRISCQPDQ